MQAAGDISLHFRGEIQIGDINLRKNELVHVKQNSAWNILKSINLAIICTIFSIIIYLMTVFVVPLILSTIVQVMMLAGQIQVATALYSVAMLYTSPAMVIGYILGLLIFLSIKFASGMFDIVLKTDYTVAMIAFACETASLYACFALFVSSCNFDTFNDELAAFMMVL